MFIRRELLTAIALSSACVHGGVHHAGEERLAKVEFEGNRRLHDKALMTGLALHRVLERGGALDPYLVQVDAERITGAAKYGVRIGRH
jgi:hypothetical protein